MNSKVQELRTYVEKKQYGQAIRKILGWFSHRIDTVLIKLFSLLPVRQNLILFRSTSDFSDNARAFYEYLIEHNYNENNKIVWILDDTDPQDYQAPANVKFIRFSSWHPAISKDYYCAVARCFIYTHGTGLMRSRRGQTFIYTTHSAAQLKAPKAANAKDTKKEWDYTLVCGPKGAAQKKISLGIREDQMLMLGMPRLDLLYQRNDCLSQLLEDYQGERIILSMETFKQARQMVDSSNCSDIYAINVIHSEDELLKLDECLKKNNTILIVKIHPWQDLSFLQFVELNNIKFMTNQDLDDKNVQLYQLIKKADTLLTDFSSVFYDYLLLDRPIGFLLEDIAEYERGFISKSSFDDMVGEKLYTISDLITFIEETSVGIDRYREERERLRNNVFIYQDGNNCKRLAEWMTEKGIIS